MELNKIYQGDAIDVLKTFPDESVDCAITSPPYWGLRDYGVLDQLGLEKTPEEYVAKMIEVFREVKRVLKKNGNFWLNLGDTYSAARWSSGKGQPMNKNRDIHRAGKETENRQSNLPDKNLVGIPWRVAFALQADGWFLRQDIIWSKPNPMPESVRDRCTKSHEYVFLLTKTPNYYFDNEAIKEPSIYPEDNRKSRVNTETAKDFQRKGNKLDAGSQTYPFRNKRSVWTITTKPFKDAHFATFPQDLILPMIKAGTSEKGVCPKCGKAWERIVERKRLNRTQLSKNDSRYRPNKYKGAYEDINGKGDAGYTETNTLGWQPTCECNKEPIPAIVLDPFMGSGTTAVVARKLGRKYLGIELNPAYVKMAERRLSQNTLF
jgi:DNA modification methylase